MALWPSSRRVGLPDLYLRVNGQETKKVSASKRAVPDATTPVESVGIAADGSVALFTSHSELTEDANTGTTSGVPNHQGADLYSYDVGTGDLTDLTADANPADVGAGADVERVLGSSRNADYVYFVAAGDLAPGATSGQRNLYVEHEGAIEFVGTDPTGDPGSFYVTPDGLHAAFMSAEGQTGYDNAGKTEVYKYSYRRRPRVRFVPPERGTADGRRVDRRPGALRRRQPASSSRAPTPSCLRRKALSPTSSSTPAVKPSC